MMGGGMRQAFMHEITHSISSEILYRLCDFVDYLNLLLDEVIELVTSPSTSHTAATIPPPLATEFERPDKQ